ncbi:hypothetical protein SNOG_00036 [Parastagonospora nodorum SN15]|uniref:Uncharacterized protein n=1 Tax=Phaeosphaeria nodorum (strain SN15 / ATCC MYA-4574 / FGSC 10173) TaxID=321614 RepID=Q0V7H8_PHANO|nr:hypothetical protein SNOG_00036 [Parastagonospora nodorum SN15]EAT91531.1 hypothetical protein SNOG_00036 [Parastagonospora nodorum SN15]
MANQFSVDPARDDYVSGKCLLTMQHVSLKRFVLATITQSWKAAHKHMPASISLFLFFWKACMEHGSPGACGVPSPALIAPPRYKVGMTALCHRLSQ